MAEYLKTRTHKFDCVSRNNIEFYAFHSGISAHGKQDHLNQQLVNNISRYGLSNFNKILISL